MAENSWKAPTVVLGIMTVLATFIGLSFKAWEMYSETEPKTAPVSTISEKEKEIEDQKAERIRMLKSDVSEVEHRIKVCEDNIARANVEISIACPNQIDNSFTEEEQDKYHERCEMATKYLADNQSEIENLEHQKENIDKQINELLH